MTDRGAPPSVTSALRAHGLRPRQSLGQNFLRDQTYARRIVDAAQLRPEDTVVEIGPGTGALTHLLAERTSALVAIELDPALAQILRSEFKAHHHVSVWEGDALQFDPCGEIAGIYTLIGNIPYYITGQILRHFLESSCPPKLAVLMVQREVAERIVAQPGKMSLLSVSVQAYGTPRIAVRVPRGAFYPIPKVDSAVLTIHPHTHPVFGPDSASFFRVARAGFGTKRKQLGNALALNLSLPREEAHRLLESAGILPTRRAETLRLDEWETLAERWRARNGS